MDFEEITEDIRKEYRSSAPDSSTWTAPIGSIERLWTIEKNIDKRLDECESTLMAWYEESVRISNQMNGISRQLEKHSEMFKVLNEILLSRNNHGNDRTKNEQA